MLFDHETNLTLPAPRESIQKFCVYLHYRNDDDTVFYVGKGIPSRPYNKYNRSQHWNNIVNKHGYSIEIIESNLHEDKAFELEIFLIEFFGRKDIKLGNLVNVTDGGEGTSGYYPSLETRKKLGDARRGEKNIWFGKSPPHLCGSNNPMKNPFSVAKIVASLTGVKKSVSHCNSMSIARKGKLLSLEHKLKIGNSIRGEKNGFFNKNHSVESKRKMSEYAKNRFGALNGRSVKIAIILNNDILHEFNSNEECGKFMKISGKNVQRWSSGSRVSTCFYNPITEEFKSMRRTKILSGFKLIQFKRV